MKWSRLKTVAKKLPMGVEAEPNLWEHFPTDIVSLGTFSGYSTLC